MALMSLRSRSHVKTSMVLTKDDHLFIQHDIRSLLNIILRHILSKEALTRVLQIVYLTP